MGLAIKSCSLHLFSRRRAKAQRTKQMPMTTLPENELSHVIIGAATSWATQLRFTTTKTRGSATAV